MNCAGQEFKFLPSEEFLCKVYSQVGMSWKQVVNKPEAVFLVVSDPSMNKL
jgi:hypothetical protein